MVALLQIGFILKKQQTALPLCWYKKAVCICTYVIIWLLSQRWQHLHPWGQDYGLGHGQCSYVNVCDRDGRCWMDCCPSGGSDGSPVCDGRLLGVQVKLHLR